MKSDPGIIFEDNSILVVDKPAGLVVNRAASVGEPTLQDWIESRPVWQESIRTGLATGAVFRARSGVVHRLDKETSGVILVAKTETAFVSLTEQFARRQVKKKYLCLVHGLMEPSEGALSLPLARSRSDREKFKVAAGGRPAQTSWKVLKIYKSVKADGVITKGYRGFSLLEVKPKTGRTHQIRVHLNHLGHTVVGDLKYGGEKIHKQDSKWCPRQFLHAYQIEFLHPETGKTTLFTSNLPEDLKGSLAQVQ